MKAIVKAENLSKQYSIGMREAGYDTLRESIVQVMRAPLDRLRGRNAKRNSETIWALKNVGFKIEPGEVVGVIGRNGAGKSTLLKVLSRITEPTTGRVELYGRVASLLEVGTGFHPELTGRENVYLNGAILGMKKTEIEGKFDQIVAFAELEKFLDTPVKRYSSGMYMRLAFAIAAHLEPEILIVDEVLAVGDASFQKKCLGKMDEVAREGRTVLFVSHNLTAIQGLCARSLWMHDGELLADGPTHQVVSDYLKTSFSLLTERVWSDITTAPGNEAVRIHGARVFPKGGAPSDPINVKTPVVIEFEYWNLVPGAFLNLSVVVNAEEGRPIFNTGSGNETLWHGQPFPPGLFRSAFHIPGELLNDGTHRVHLYVIKNQSSVLFDLDDILVFDVEDLSEREAWFGKWIGAVRPNLNWQTELLEGGEFVVVLDLLMDKNVKRGVSYSALKFGFMRLPEPLRLHLLSALNSGLKLSAKVKVRMKRLKLRVVSTGGRYRCSVCGSRVRSFEPIDPYILETASKYGFRYTAEEAEMCNVKNYTCPFCTACDRDRMYALYLRAYFNGIVLGDPLRFIDFAPTGALSDFIKESISRSPQTFFYRTADLFREDVNDRVDIMDMSIYGDESVDFFICSHILEHVTDDRKALSELYRILKPAGRGILVVPIVLSIDEIDEDPSLTDVGERWRRFGQDDHVRMYSKNGFLSRTREAGFNVQELGLEHFGKDTFETYGITDQSILYIVEKK